MAACGGGSDASGGSNPASGPAQMEPDAVAAGWTRAPSIYAERYYYYSSLIFTDHGGLSIYTPSGPGGDGVLHLSEGSVDYGVKMRGPVLKIDDPAEAYVRTFGITRRGGRCYALLFAGTGYPTTNGYAPNWAESDDGVHWEYKGNVNPFPRRPFSSSMTLTVDDQGLFRAWTDNAGGTLREMSSRDGLHWQDGGDIWPKSLPAREAVFPNATRAAHGTMLAVADAWPSTKIRVLWQCDGSSEWKVLEEDSPIHAYQKGTALAWDGSLIHAYARGDHWPRPEPACP